MGFSAFPDGGRFEALYRPGPRSRGVRGGAGERREGVCRRGVRCRGPRVTRAGRAQGEGRSRGARLGRGNRLSAEVSGLFGRERVAPGPAARPAAPVVSGTACRRAPGRRKPLFLPSPRPPRPAHTSSLTHFAAQAVIWRQRRRPRLPGTRFVLDAAKP